MKCKELRPLTSAYLFNDLNAEEKLSYEDHLSSCSSCQKEQNELKKLLKITKMADTYPEPVDDFWSTFDDRFDKRLQIEGRNAILESSNIPIKKPFAVYKKLALAASLLIIVVASTFFTSTNQVSDLATNRTDAIITPIEMLGERTENYFDNARKLLFNILHTETGEDSLIDITLEKEYAAKLLEESRYLQISLPDAKKPELVRLVNQLETTLLQIAHLEANEDAPEVEIVQDGIRKNAILMKINLHKINQLLEENRKNNKESNKPKSKT